MSQSTVISKSSPASAAQGVPSTLGAFLRSFWAATPAAIFFKALSEARDERKTR